MTTIDPAPAAADHGISLVAMATFRLDVYIGRLELLRSGPIAPGAAALEG